MLGSQQYRRQSILGGMTRVEMLIALYDRAILHLNACREANENNDGTRTSLEQFQAQKMIFGLFAGLNTDDSEVAANIGRLLGFVMDCLVKREYQPAIKVLENLREAFTQIRPAANTLEQSGAIPSLGQSHAIEVTV